MKNGSFVWYELMTNDLEAAQAFYAKVVGWAVVDSGMTPMRYLLAKVGERQVAGLMQRPSDAAPIKWFGYIAVGDVDVAADEVRQARGAVHHPPTDIPEIGRFAVVADPHGAVFMLFRGSGDPPPELAPATPGDVGWRELHTTDWESAFAFYERLFGWEKSYAHDMGSMGVYQTFSVDGTWVGGMMTAAAPADPPAWTYYINVDDIDAAAARVAEAGGAVLQGPHQVPGGSWIIVGRDPQGARFALVGGRKD